MGASGCARGHHQSVGHIAERRRHAVEKLFPTRGYFIPERLVRLTGGGPETWESIIQLHQDEYARYCPIRPDHHVLEIGCGVGRDAIPLTEILSSEGRYLGIDIIEPSIGWCAQNITPVHPNFEFVHLDIGSQIHHPNGKLKTTDVRLPGPDGSFDRILLQSVFTHMFRDDIIHYLREFRRLLRPSGLVFASLFLLDKESLHLARASGGPLTFAHQHDEGCWITDAAYPEGAVGYSPEVFTQMLEASGMAFAQPLHLGSWCGRPSSDAQDVAILQPA